MSGWISKAANVFKRDVPETPQPFDISCECGQQHSGLRRARHQHLVCKTCGASIFILPRDVYPPPHTPLRAKPQAKATPTALVDEVDPIPDGEAEMDILLAEEDAVPPPRPSTSPRPRDLPVPRPTKRQRKRQKQAEREQPPEVTPSSGPGFLERAVTGLAAAFQHLVQSFVRFWTPFRAVVVGVLLVLAITGWWSLYQRGLSQAVVVAKTESAAGFAAAEKADWVTARDHFERATRAIDRLGRDDSESRRVRQYFHETRALTRLSNLGLFELLKNVPAKLNEKQAEEWQKTFSSRYGGNWLILEGLVRKATPEKGRATRSPYALTLPAGVAPGGKKVTVRADFPAFDKIVSSKGEADAIFAGELESCEPAEGGQEWIVRLRPDSGFLWANPETFQSLGFSDDPARPDEPFAARLLHQAQRTGVAP